MIFSTISPQEKRQKFIQKLSASCLRFVGSFSPLVSRLIESKGFDGIYVSGAVVSSHQALPDIGLTSLTEVANNAESITESVNLPSIVDADTGFGEASNCARSLYEFEKKGLSGLHIEDQLFPKRCGHLNEKKLIPIEDMLTKIRACVQIRKDKNFLIIARTDARGVEGMEEAIYRAQAYKEAGADMIFPEALLSIEEFQEFRSKISTPLIANMTEFGKTDIIPYQVFKNMGYNIVIYPVSTWRLALKAVDQGLNALFEDRQEDLLSDMLTREELYELLSYKDYNSFDKELFNFKIKKHKT